MDNFLNTIDNVDLSILQNYKLEFQDIRHEFTENFKFNKFFIVEFCDLISLYNKIPTQEEFRLYYIKNNIEYLKENFFLFENRKLLLNSLIARLNRAYPSLVRDIHFSLFLKQNTDLNIFYNPLFDVIEGIDCLINDTYALRLFTDTKTSWSNRYKKDNRRIYSDKYNYIDVPIKLTYDKKVGMFYLYNNEDLIYIKKQIK